MGQRLQKELALKSTMRKVTYFAPDGDYGGVPAALDSIISPTGFKSLGVWRGPRDGHTCTLSQSPRPA